MVNTRRSESHRMRPHRTRGATKLEEQDSDPSSAKEEEGEEEEEEESDLERSNSDDDSSSNTPLVKLQASVKKTERPKVTKVVTIQRRFQRKFSASSQSRDSRRQLAVDRRRLDIYADRKMNREDFSDDEEDEENYYSNPRVRRQTRLIKKNRILRRTALSLRPISQKSYVDKSPFPFESDSDGNVRRSARSTRNNRSWLADSQMHKMGYPNLNAGFSEEDSRDAADVRNNEAGTRVTRHSNRRVIKPVYYYDEFDEPAEIRRARKSARHVEKQIRLDSRQDQPETSQENKENAEKNSRPTRSKTGPVKYEAVSDDESKSSKETEPPKKEEKGGAETPPEKNDRRDVSSGSEDDEEDEQVEIKEEKPSPMQKRVRLRQEIKLNRTRDLRSESSESEEDEGRRKYSLRNRPPKPASKSMQRPERSRYTRRRRKGSSSDFSASSSEICRKTQKNQHTKKEMIKSGAGGSSKVVIAPIKPETLDQSVRFNSIGGLHSHIQCLKEMIVLPMMYPEIFRKFQIQPPRGVLFHGPPGTGKTLISRALANECSQGMRKVSFFMRRGADLLSKWIGESENQLKQLFEQAAEMKPSIIFFDELDGLAPVRSSRQDQVHASIVSTLLALMDGLVDRGDVIVIGATNRIDAIDPALRRPGRFDRELYFPLPSKSEREEILKVHVASWSQPPTDDLISYLANATVGYCGSDLRALCSEAVINSFRRTYPQVYDCDYRLLLNPDNVKVEKVDFLRAKSVLVPASHRVESGFGKKLIPILQPLVGDAIKMAIKNIEEQFPHGTNATLAKVKLSSNLKPAQLLLTGNGPYHGQSSYIAPALLFEMEHIHAHLLDTATLFTEPGRTPEKACIQVFSEAKRNIPSIIYIPNIDTWWELISETVKAIFIRQIRDMDLNIPILILATADVTYDELPEELQELFSMFRDEVLEIKPPTSTMRYEFFKQLVVDACLKPVRNPRERPNTPPPLPRAPTPPPTPITEEQSQKLFETEEHTLRELRIFLRDMCKKLANNKLFFMFTKPVDTEEVPDYPAIIKEPMDLETMMTKVDYHGYECAKDFLNDIDLIVQNALEYNPAKTSADKQIRHRACSLRDYAYTLIKTEMDSDFEDKCQDIKQKRKKRKACVRKYLPAYIAVPDTARLEGSTNEHSSEKNGERTNEKETEKQKICSIKKRKFSWQQGYVRRKKKPRLDSAQINKLKNSSDESKENDPDSSTMEIPSQCESEKVDVTQALSINCDNQKTVSSSQTDRPSSKVLAELLSPSELLDSPLCSDEVDLALNENATNMPVNIKCSEKELKTVLQQMVTATEETPLMLLMDLYNQINGIIKKYAKTAHREELPEEFRRELTRFEESKLVKSNEKE